MQPGFFDLDSRHQQLEKLGGPLPKLAELVDWEGFRPLLDRIREKERKSTAGRKPYDVVLMFKWIKQNLKIRSVLGHTINAVATQIIVALCIYLLIAYQKFVSQTGYGLQAVFRLMQLNAFVHKPIADLLCPRKAEPPDPQFDLTLRAA